MNENERTALVTGGSRGIGRAAVLRLADEGYNIAFCYMSDDDAARALEKEVSERGVRVLCAKTDVSDAASARDFVTSAQEQFDAVDLVVTSAGIVRDNPLLMMGDEDWNNVIDVNLNGTYNICRAAIFEMLKRKSGCIVNVSSVAGVHGNATQSNYSASKAGIIGFTKAVAKEVGPYGIRANVVAPGFIDTDMTASLSDDFRKRVLQQIPLRKLGRPEQVAEMISYLAGAEYVTGSVMQIDGGIVI
ncbi:3-oxoacyl-ACP reductase [Streptomyces abyssalis]|uniref:3-oxoacyl-[acyl-carrier-protein] reductase n=1 Tax=Streptomyces abyssalis TaxID=933944 RepID=A0A1E7JMW5_9ACTN|nr:3-oxoacyl-[acyl-carrier-protein] reductase [Streptomyces abyssalis]OEU87004.1 3-oxoacyl-ACP reductase [Streptomyces abyssalis]OEU89611.1 3-oxoacyl-ACP reductase [Streptomyces abyssalis]OEV21092.1 3-oxoacyl-ACP reductase [Streptomyces nanshensis]